MLENEYLEISKQISSLKAEREELESKLKLLDSKKDIIECKYDIIKIDEKIPVLEDKLDLLVNQIREKRNDLFFKEFYIEFNTYIPIFKRTLNLNQLSNDDVIRYVIDNRDDEQVSKMIKIFTFLEPSQLDNFRNDILIDEIPFNTLLKEYDNKCNSVENLVPDIKNKIKKVEEGLDLKFNGFAEHNNMTIEFIRDFSQEVEFELFILKNFEDHVYSELEYLRDDGYFDGIDIDVGDCWEHMSEYEKLNLVSVDHFCDWYVDSLFSEVDEIVGDDFDYDINIRIPLNRKSLYAQTQEYKNKKEKLFEKKVQRYNDLIEKKRHVDETKPEEPECIKTLNEDSTIEEIANCYCKCEDFNNWELDEKNKKVVFKFLRADGKNYTKMKSVEIKKLKKWAEFRNK